MRLRSLVDRNLGGAACSYEPTVGPVGEVRVGVRRRRPPGAAGAELDDEWTLPVHGACLRRPVRQHDYRAVAVVGVHTELIGSARGHSGGGIDERLQPPDRVAVGVDQPSRRGLHDDVVVLAEPTPDSGPCSARLAVAEVPTASAA